MCPRLCLYAACLWCSVDIKGTFEAKGIKGAKDRVQFVAAEIREPWPEAVRKANVDTLIMKHFLSGFSDKEASLILKHISDIQQSGSHILLFQVAFSFSMHITWRQAQSICVSAGSG